MFGITPHLINKFDSSIFLHGTDGIITKHTSINSRPSHFYKKDFKYTNVINSRPPLEFKIGEKYCF